MAARTGYWISRFFDIPFSFTAHANDIFAPRDFVISLPKLLDEAVAIVSVSDFAVERLASQFPQARAKLHRVYNGIDLSAFRPSDFAAPVPLIVSIGRLIEKKGFTDLISACGILKRQGRDFRCEIIGDGPLEKGLAAQIAEAGLHQHVSLVGPKTQAEIAGRLAASNLFVLACTTEADGGMDNLPTVIMEAMAAGLPVVSTALAGVPEMVQDGVTGKLVPPRDAAALAEAIGALMADAAGARALGAAGRALAAERFSVDANVRALAAVLALN
jgi:glycosyltransferase involved in cell wall biosynthesis